MKLAERLRDIREGAGLSQSDLEAQSGVGRSVIQRIESGDGNPTVDTLMALADALKVSWETMAGFSPKRKVAEALANQKIGPKLLSDPDFAQAIDFLSRFSSLPTHLQKMALAIVYEDATLVRGLKLKDAPEPLSRLIKAMQK